MNFRALPQNPPPSSGLLATLFRAYNTVDRLVFPPNHKKVSKYDKWKSGVANILVNPRELVDGVHVNAQKMGGFGDSYGVLILNGIVVGSQVQPPEFNMGIQMNFRNALLFGRFDTNQVVFGTMRTMLTPAASLEVAFNNANYKWISEFDYDGKDFKANLKYRQSKLTASYIQYVTRQTLLGSAVSYDVENRKSNIEVVGSYSALYNNTCFKYKVKDAGDKNEHLFKVGYSQAVRDEFSAAGEFGYNITKRDSNYKVGFCFQSFGATYKVTLDPQFNMMATLDMPLAGVGTMTVSCMSRSDDNFKLGFAVNLGPSKGGD